MMKQFILSGLFIAFVFASFGQYTVRLSFTGSPSVNWMSTNSSIADRGKSTIGYDYGLNGDVYFSENDRYAISTGLQISNIGGEIRYRSNSSFQFAGATLDPQTKIKYSLRYVEIPFAVKLKTDQFDRTRYWGLFGLSGMINIDAKADSNDGILRKADVGDEVNLFNITMNVGVGFDFDLSGSNAISAGLIFQNGLVDATTDNFFTDKTIINSLKFKIGLIF